MKNPCFIKSNFIFRWSGPNVDYLDFYSNHSNVIPNLPFKIRFYLWLKSIFLTLYLFLKMKMMLAFLKPTKTISFGHFCFNQTVKHYWFAVVVRCWVLWFDLIQTLLQDSWAYFDKMVRSKTIRYYTINQWINKVCQIFLGASRRLKKKLLKNFNNGLNNYEMIRFRNIYYFNILIETFPYNFTRIWFNIIYLVPRNVENNNRP